METESPSRPLTPHGTKDSRAFPSPTPNSRGDPTQFKASVLKVQRVPSATNLVHKTVVRPTYTGLPLSDHLPNRPLLNRIGSVSSDSPNPKTDGSVVFGGHYIALNGHMTNLTSRPFSRMKVKKGPRRLAKLEARQRHNLALPPVPSLHGPSILPTNAADGLTRHQQAQPTRVDLDAEMEEYRRRGLMGLSGQDK